MHKNVMVIAAHTDDEALGCAGTIARHVSEGDKVHLLFMTDGVGSREVQNFEVEARARSAVNAAKLLNVSSSTFFDFPDNRMDAVALLDITQKIESKISELQPSIIYTHHVGDLNIDHQITHKAVMTACRPQPEYCVKEIYSFEVLSSTEWQTPGLHSFLPNVFVDITKFIGVKKSVLDAYSEEMREPPHSRSVDNAIALCNVRGNVVGVPYAEAFVMVRCLK